MVLQIVGVELEGNERLRAAEDGKAEAARHHPDDGVRLAVEDEGATALALERSARKKYQFTQAIAPPAAATTSQSAPVMGEKLYTPHPYIKSA